MLVIETVLASSHIDPQAQSALQGQAKGQAYLLGEQLCDKPSLTVTEGRLSSLKDIQNVN